MSGIMGMVHYPSDGKLEAVRLFYEEGKIRAEIATILGLRSEWRVKEWGRSYRRTGEMAFDQPIGRPRKA